ncbi:RpiB/LacA/LacB family sugar-phosphate isomerase [Candidatus Uhrbacteria bacterium]|nr:RpiB/LacA/LacB family sugar-phosphate isomerase [Candidatus Uhrbacteria bacterium]
MHIAIGADHRGFPLKEQLKPWLIGLDHTVEDTGATALDPADDYPDFGVAVGRAVATDPDARGIVLCGSGIGIAIAANKVANVRAGTCATPEQCRNARADEDLNVLALSADALDFEHAKLVITAFLETPFSGAERHARRLEKLGHLDHAR